MFKLVPSLDYKISNNESYKSLPNSVDIYLLLNGYSVGNVYQHKCGDLLVIRGSKTPFAVYTGNVNQNIIEQIVNILSPYKYCALSLQEKNLPYELIELMLSQNYEYIPRLRFTSLNADKLPETELLSSRFEFIKIDNWDKLQKCYQHKYLLDLYGSIDNYLNYCYGIGILDKTTGIIASETHAFLGADLAEPTVSTRDGYITLGLSTMANYKLMQDILTKGYVFEWTCDSDNHGSIAIAKKLGLQQIDGYTMFHKDLR